MSKQEIVSEGRPWLTPTAALRRASETLRLGADNGPMPLSHSIRYGFRVGPLHLMVGPDVLNEVLREVSVYALPGAPQWISGLLNLRGNLAPVFDLHNLFGFSNEIEDSRGLLALDRGTETVCIYVDDLPERVAMDHQVKGLPPLPAWLRDHVDRAFSGNGSVWIEFRHASFFRSLAGAWGGRGEQG